MALLSRVRASGWRLGFALVLLFDSTAGAQLYPVVGRSFPGTARVGYHADGAVGPAHYAEYNNQGLRVVSLADGAVYQKVSVWSNDGSYSQFRILYDHSAARWFLLAVTSTHFFVAISVSSDPTAGWREVNIEADANRRYRPSFPSLGVDANSVCITALMLDSQSQVTTSGVFIIPKADLLGTSPSVARVARSLEVNTNVEMRPQLDYLGTASDGFLIDPGYAFFSTGTKTWTVDYFNHEQVAAQGASIRNVAPRVQLPAQSFRQDDFAESVTLGGPQPGTVDKIATWGVKTIAGKNIIRVGDFIYAVSHDSHGGVCYKKFRVSTRTLVDVGGIGDPNHSYIDAGIGANTRGDVVIALIRSGADEYGSLYCAAGQPDAGGRLLFTAPLRLKPGIDILEGNALETGSPTLAWLGYYGPAVSVSPTDSSRFWVSGAFVSGRNTASTWISEIMLSSTPAVPPQIILQPGSGDGVVTAGASKTFVVEAVSAAPLTFQWQRQLAGSSAWFDLTDDATFRGSSTPSLLLNAAKFTMTADQIRCVVSNASGSVNSKPVRLVVETSYFVTVVAGAAEAGFVNGAAAQARFSLPQGIVIDRAGQLYVADSKNNVVRSISPAGVVDTFFPSPTSALPPLQSTQPRNLALDSGDNLYVDDGVLRGIRVIIPPGFVRTVVPGLIDRAVDFDILSAGGMAISSKGVLYIADNRHVIRQSASGGPVTTLAGRLGLVGSNDGAGDSARFNRPQGIVVDSAGNLFVADCDNCVIRMVTPAGAVTTFAGRAGLAGARDGAGAEARLNFPGAMTIDDAGNLFIIDDFTTIRKVSPAGFVSTPEFHFDHAPANGRLMSGITVDRSGTLYFTDGNLIRRANPIGIPEIETAPLSVEVTAAQTATFSVAARSGDGSALMYQWRKDGMPVAGATSATLTIANAKPADAGSYRVTIWNDSGLTTSSSAVLHVRFSRLANVSVRGIAGAGDESMIVGLTIGGAGSKHVLLRGVGPTLERFGMVGAVPEPQLTLFEGRTPIAQNSGWGGGAALADAFAAAGAFGLPVDSKDTALLTTLSVNSYSAQITARTGTGVALLEAYDIDPGFPSARLTNISVRNFVTTGANVVILGVVVTGDASETLLIRAVGPGLSAFGLGGVLADPQIVLSNSRNVVVAQNDDWGGETRLASAFSGAGAFALPASSKDAALLVTLPAGSYTIQVSGVNGTAGVALVEIYEVP